MLSINIGNVLSIAAISILGYAGLKFGLKAVGVELPWLP